jgi:hypothetical protein
MKLSRLCWALPSLILLLSGCSYKDGSLSQVTGPDSILLPPRVMPSTLTLVIGSTATLTVVSETNVVLPNSSIVWSSSNNSVATVSANGLVTGINNGTVTIIASSVTDPTVKGAAAVTVGTLPPTGNVSIASINQTNAAGQSVPANLTGVAGMIDILVQVPTDSSPVTIVASVKVGTDSLVQTRTLPASSGATGLATVTFTMNTAQKDASGAPILHNGNATLTVTATTSSTPAKSASSSITFALANPM